MEEDAINLAIRRFLKQFGVSSQREMELAARSGKGGRTLKVRATLEVNGAEAYSESAEIPLD